MNKEVQKDLDKLSSAWFATISPDTTCPPKILFTLGYYWSKVQGHMSEGRVSKDEFEEALYGPYYAFHMAINNYIEGLPNDNK